jgi:hypothetical protein
LEVIATTSFHDRAERLRAPTNGRPNVSGPRRLEGYARQSVERALLVLPTLPERETLDQLDDLAEAAAAVRRRDRPRDDGSPGPDRSRRMP